MGSLAHSSSTIGHWSQCWAVGKFARICLGQRVGGPVGPCGSFTINRRVNRAARRGATPAPLARWKSRRSRLV